MLRSIAATMGLLVLLWMPIAQSAPCGGFTDVDDANSAHAPFCESVEWIKNRGITLGCASPPNPPNSYCPNENVTRLQMAAFMYRLGFQNAFLRDGNAFGATAVLGTTDNQPLDIRVNNARVMRYQPDAISPIVIGGSPANNVTAGVRGATIAGGGVPAGDADPDATDEAPNRVTDHYGTVAGGYANRAGNDFGALNDAWYATVGGGRVNTAGGPFSTVAGGTDNTASNFGSTVAGGLVNTASGEFSIVAGGVSNTASAIYSAVAGGFGSNASGSVSFAAGNFANANADGCFVWGDSSTGNQISCNFPNRFVVRSLGGVFFFAGGNTQPTYTGVHLPPGATAWVFASDRRIKDNLRDIDVQDILQRLVAMPITTWNLKAQDPSIRHIGPMAQDFRAAFSLGETELGINTLDADGVAFAAIQGLNAKLEAERAAKDAEIATLRAELSELRELRGELAAIRAVLANIAGLQLIRGSR